MKWTDPEIISRTAIVLLVGLLFLYLINSMVEFGDGYMEKRPSQIEQIIGKALVQCYALEGEYPVEIEYVEKYGVIFDNDKYFYHYEWFGSNLKPTVTVIEK